MKVVVLLLVCRLNERYERWLSPNAGRRDMPRAIEILTLARTEAQRGLDTSISTGNRLCVAWELTSVLAPVNQDSGNSRVTKHQQLEEVDIPYRATGPSI